MKEIWKVHPDYKEVKVSNIGRVMTMDRVHYTLRGDVRYKGRLLKLNNEYTGAGRSMYQKCKLYVPSCIGSKNRWVHRLVAQTWVNNPMCYKYVDHIDGNGLNNRFDNLEWVTNRENFRRSFEKGDHKNVIYINGKCLSDISHNLGSKHSSMVSKRLKRGWCIECATTIPGIGNSAHRDKCNKCNQ